MPKGGNTDVATMRYTGRAAAILGFVDNSGRQAYGDEARSVAEGVRRGRCWWSGYHGRIQSGKRTLLEGIVRREGIARLISMLGLP